MKQQARRMQAPAVRAPDVTRTDHDSFVDAPPDFRFPVVRTRLMADLVSRALQKPSGLATVETLLSPHGWGKTVVLAEVFRAWRRDAGLPGVWLGLGYLDDDLDTVILQLSRQIAAWVPGVAPSLLTEQGPIYGAQDRILWPLLESLPRPFLICIDNIDNCTQSLAPGALDALFDFAPPGIHFLLTSNRSLGYDRVGALMRGALREHGVEELAFADAEAREMLGRAVQSIGSEELPALLERAEGWAAGLRLVAMLLDGPEGGSGMLSRFSGAAPGLRDWFDRKVLAAMPAQMHRFLLFASLLPSFEPGQVGKAIGAGNVQKHMDSMLAQGMFIMPVAGRGKRFRMHQLLRDRLRAEAEQTIPETERVAFCRDMALRALENRLWEEAIAAARSTRSDSLIAQVLERAAPSLVRDMCRMRYFVEVVDELIAAGVPLGFETRYWHVFALTFYLRHASAGRHLEQLRSMARGGGEGGGSLMHRVEHLSVALAFLRDDLPLAGRHARQWLDSGHDKDPFDHAWVLSVMAAYHLTAYRFAETRDCLWRARALAHEVRSPYLTGWCDLILGASYLYEGNVFRAREIIDQALARAEQALGADADLCDLISSVASKCAIEAGDHEKARELLARALRSMHKHGNVGTSMCAVDAALQLWNGDESDPVLLRLKSVVTRYSFRLRLMFSCYLIRRLVSLGRVADAQAEAAAIGLDPAEGCVRLAGGEILPRTRDIITMTAIELLLGIGDSGAARKLAERERDVAEHDGRTLRQARLELVLMALARQRGDDAEAANRLRTALLLARRRQMVEAFRRHRPDIDALLASRAFRAEHFPNPDDRAFLSRLLAHLGIEEPGSTESPRPADAGVPLTGRERELMRLVQSGLSNPEICEIMNLSRNTVKWHLKNIFTKLDVPNRTVAAMVYSE
ncbi:LuxR C-terminal-related transcriptional regulator [Paracoccus sp. N5]|uniref:LuxR C-terminal-related transcriptional regulator n=1 Tax=Paracoccus sp. N5 TaxID=1101189 RepID=UPI0003A6F5E6|nr:LuxR C-terminal-related transcriptional regulator [Paracoccus sp. N5]